MGLPVTRANPAKNHSAKAFRESAVARSNSSLILPSLIEALNRRKSLIVAISRGGDPFWKRMGLIVSAALTTDLPLVLKSPAFKRLFSRETIHLLDLVNISP